MLEKYRSAIAQMPDDVVQAVGERLGLPAGQHLYEGLGARGLCQADLALVLLSLPGEPAAAALASLVGFRPTRVPAPAVWPRPLPGPPGPSGPDARRVLRVARNPRLPTTNASLRYREFRVGLTVAQLLARGVTRRDIREATSAGWVELEEARA